MSVGTVFDRFGLFVSYEFAETSETMREVRTIVHEKRTLRGDKDWRREMYSDASEEVEGEKKGRTAVCN